MGMILRLFFQNNYINIVGDKGLSIGENSRLIGKNISINNGKLNFFDGEGKYILSLDNINFKYNPDQSLSTTILTADFAVLFPDLV